MYVPQILLYLKLGRLGRWWILSFKQRSWEDGFVFSGELESQPQGLQSSALTATLLTLIERHLSLEALLIHRSPILPRTSTFDWGIRLFFCRREEYSVYILISVSILSLVVLPIAVAAKNKDLDRRAREAQTVVGGMGGWKRQD